MAKKKMYALISWEGWKLKGKLNENEDKLFHPTNKKLWLSLGKDTTILKRFATKAEMNACKV